MRAIEYRPDNTAENKIILGLFWSILMHFLLFYAFLRVPHNNSILQGERSFEVSFIREQEKPVRVVEAETRQIVTPPDNVQETSQVIESALLSDKNLKTEREQIKRGAPDSGPTIGKAEKALPTNLSKEHQASQPNQIRENPPQRLDTLRLDSQTLMDKFAKPSAPVKAGGLNPSPGYQAFSRPAGSGAAFIGLSGSSDYLPNLPDGDITLLNTKASQYAVFVRRVATLVFSHMRRTGWETMRASDINRIRDFSTVRAVLDRDGNLIRVTLEEPSGSQRFDETLTLAVKKGAKDPNPPKEALAEDGNFHFIFKSKSWSQLAHNPRTGSPFERRWLLLSTGLL